MIPKFLHNKAEFHQEWRKRVGEDRLLSVEGKSFALSVAWSTVEQSLKILMTLWNLESPKSKHKKARKVRKKLKRKKK